MSLLIESPAVGRTTTWLTEQPHIFPRWFMRAEGEVGATTRARNHRPNLSNSIPGTRRITDSRSRIGSGAPCVTPRAAWVMMPIPQVRTIRRVRFPASGLSTYAMLLPTTRYLLARWLSPWIDADRTRQLYGRE
jgi:hypothetical protein